jgi:hypothetical protein
VFFVCYVGSGLCDRIITRSEEFYRLYGGLISCDIKLRTEAS